MPEEIQQLKERIQLLENLLFAVIKSDQYYFGKQLVLADGLNMALSTGTGSKIGTATGQKLGFYNATPVIQQTSGGNLTNNVAEGGTTNQIDNFTDLTTYSNSAATIRNDIYQLARKLKQVNDGLRSLGILS